MTRRILLAFAATTLFAAPAWAQPSAPRALVSINGGWQSPDRTFSDAFTYEVYLENATAGVDYKARSAPVYDGALGVRLWRALGLGIAASRYTDRTAAHVTGSVPHPFFFSRGRAIEGEASGIQREETAVHAQVLAFVPAGNRVLLVLSAGPSSITLRQRVVTGVQHDESYPFDTATYKAADMTTRSERQIGLNAGADIVIRFGRAFGVGALVRYTQARIELSPAEGRTITLDAGGFQAGAGIRVIF